MRTWTKLGLSLGVMVTLLVAVGFLPANSHIFSQVFSQVAQAQGADDSAWSTQRTREEIVNYQKIIEQCDELPSLECLTHHTYTYTNIEVLTRISGVPREGGSGGVISGFGNLIKAMYDTPPAQSGLYVADLMESMKIIPQAQAQGLGFAALNPILELWKMFRNLAYIFFVLMAIVIGFMIMFRKKISGQTAITAQQAIPGVVISLVFVTFSYAIVGFMIDMMYLSMLLIAGLFGSVGGFSTDVLNENIVGLGARLFGALGPRGLIDHGVSGDIVTTFLENSHVVDNRNAIKALGFLGGLTLSVIVSLAVLFGIIKLFFELLRSYATVVLLTVVSPIILMMGAIPGNNAFMGWVKQVAGNLLPFPTVLLIIVMFHFFTDTEGGMRGEGGFMPPFLLNVSGGQAPVITSLLGLAIILALPEIVKHVKEAVAGKGGFGEMLAGWGWAGFKKGWEGGELVPGIGMTNTSKLPLGSGKDWVRKGAIGLGAVGAGATLGPLAGLWREGYRGVVPGMIDTGRRAGRNIASFMGDPTYQWYKKKREERAKKSKSK